MTSSAAADWNFVCGSRSMVTTSECVMWTGVMAGAVLFGSFSDKFGRANAVNLAVCVNIIGGILVAISPYSPVFLITLFCQGSTLSGLLMSSFVLAVEHIGNECHLLASDIVSPIRSEKNHEDDRFPFLKIHLLPFFLCSLKFPTEFNGEANFPMLFRCKRD